MKWFQSLFGAHSTRTAAYYAKQVIQNTRKLDDARRNLATLQRVDHSSFENDDRDDHARQVKMCKRTIKTLESAIERGNTYFQDASNNEREQQYVPMPKFGQLNADIASK